MLPNLTRQSYFENFTGFLLSPLQAKKNDRIKALALSILIGFLTVGTLHLMTAVAKMCRECVKKNKDDLNPLDLEVGNQFQKNVQNPAKYPIDLEEQLPIKAKEQLPLPTPEPQDQNLNPPQPINQNPNPPPKKKIEELNDDEFLNEIAHLNNPKPKVAEAPKKTAEPQAKPQNNNNDWYNQLMNNLDKQDIKPPVPQPQPQPQPLPVVPKKVEVNPEPQPIPPKGNIQLNVNPLQTGWNAKPMRANGLPGFSRENFHTHYVQVPDQIKYQARNGRMQSVLSELGIDMKDNKMQLGPFFQQTLNVHIPNMKYEDLSEENQKLMQDVTFYPSPDSKGTYKGKKILGRFDVIEIKTSMDIDFQWKELKGPQQPFSIHHAAAINIGERVGAEDFADYSNNGQLDEDRYIQDMRRLFKNILDAQKQSGAKHAVWFPMGMGAFLRNLDFNDLSYDRTTENGQAKIHALRERIAAAFIEEVAKVDELDIHLCLPCVTDLQITPNKDVGRWDQNHQGSVATNQNYNAFLKALFASPEAQKRVKLYVNMDASLVAQKLANENQNQQVSLTNGANANLLGNHWFDYGALVAIDENLHRRSNKLALASALLNDGCEYKDRPQDYLKLQVEKFKGKVVEELD